MEARFPVAASRPSAWPATSGVPVDALAVVLNLTVVNPAGPGFVAAYPAGSTVPPTSIDYTAGQVVPNLVEVGTGTSGDVSFYSSNETDLVVDIEGYTAPTASGGAGAGLIQPSPPQLGSVTPERGPKNAAPERSVQRNGQCWCDSQCRGNDQRLRHRCPRNPGRSHRGGVERHGGQCSGPRLPDGVPRRQHPAPRYLQRQLCSGPGGGQSGRRASLDDRRQSGSNNRVQRPVSRCGC